MKTLRFLLILAVSVPQTLWALPQTREVNCPSSANQFRLIRDMMEEKVLASIDLNQFEKPVVRIELKLLTVDTAMKTVGPDEVVPNVEIGIAQTPPGLALSVQGTISYIDLCQYTYRASTKVRARNKTTGKIERSRQETTLTIFGQNNGRVRKVNSPA